MTCTQMACHSTNRPCWLWRNQANIVTLLRIPLSIAIGFFTWFDYKRVVWVASLGLAGYLSDALDGALARWTETTSEFGRKADCTMDKFMELSQFVYLMRHERTDPLIWWVVLVSATVELLSLILRAFILWEGVKTKTTGFGKWKMRLFGFATSACLAKLIIEDYWPQMKWPSPVHQVIFLVFAAGAISAALSLWQHWHEYCLHEAE